MTYRQSLMQEKFDLSYGITILDLQLICNWSNMKWTDFEYSDIIIKHGYLVALFLMAIIALAPTAVEVLRKQSCLNDKSLL